MVNVKSPDSVVFAEEENVMPVIRNDEALHQVCNEAGNVMPTESE